MGMQIQNELAITNTYFQQPNRYKTTWQHPRSIHWHMLGYVITRHRNLEEVHITRVMRGTCCWSDHRLVRSVVALSLCRPRCHRAVRCRRLDVAKLQLDEYNYKQELQKTLSSQLASSPPDQSVTNTAHDAVETLLTSCF